MNAIHQEVWDTIKDDPEVAALYDHEGVFQILSVGPVNIDTYARCFKVIDTVRNITQPGQKIEMFQRGNNHHVLGVLLFDKQQK